MFKLLLRSDCELSWFEEGRLDSLLGTEEIEDHDVFNADYEAFKKRINDAVKEGGTIVVIPGTVQGLVVDMFVFGKLLEQYNSAAKVKFLVRSKRMEHFPTEVDFDKVKGELGISDNVEKIVVELDSPGCHLDDMRALGEVQGFFKRQFFLGRLQKEGHSLDGDAGNIVFIAGRA